MKCGGGLGKRRKLFGGRSLLLNMGRMGAGGGLLLTMDTIGRECGVPLLHLVISSEWGKVLSKGVGFVVDEGREVRFWLDD